MKHNKNSKTPQLPVKRSENPIVKVSKHGNPLDISEKLQHFKNRDEVRKFLPDILGRVLARVWIDSNFREQFATDPQKTLEFNGVILPDDMTIEFQKPNSDRPKIIVYEKKQNSNFKIRVVQLQLVMLAGR